MSGMAFSLRFLTLLPATFPLPSERGSSLKTQWRRTASLQDPPQKECVMHQTATIALRARTVYPLAEEPPARGWDALAAPLRAVDNGVVQIRRGVVEAVGRWPMNLPSGTEIRDMGDVALIPGIINAHCHIQLSWTAGRTLWGQGFAPWLRSLISLLRARTLQDDNDAAIDGACAALADCGTRHVADYAGQALPVVDAAAARHGVGITHLCEWFGAQPPFIDDRRPWPPHCRRAAATLPGLDKRCAPAGHALYSTAANALRDAHAFCMALNRPFALHLAENEEELHLLETGGGPLWDIYAGQVLPQDWRTPRRRPVAYARELGLLGSGTLAVHCVHVDAAEAALLARSGTAVCLCPRSNAHLAVGEAPVEMLAHAGVLLCLGTDGLSSNSDLDVRREAVALRQRWGLPAEALIRMLTVNAAAALNLGNGLGRLLPGSAAGVAVLPEALLP